MLNEACLRLRETFEPSEPDALDAANREHLETCADCAAWTKRLSEAVEAARVQAPRAMPAALGNRLRALSAPPIRRDAMECDEAERLYDAARRPEAIDPRLREHLDDCPRCAALYAPLRAFFATPVHRLPEALALRLRAIARRDPLPWWVRDPRWVAAAGVLLTFLCLPLLSLYQHDAERLATVGRYRAGAAMSQMKNTVLTESRQRLTRLHEGRENLKQWIGSTADQEGENHGRSQSRSPSDP